MILKNSIIFKAIWILASVFLLNITSNTAETSERIVKFREYSIQQHTGFGLETVRIDVGNFFQRTQLKNRDVIIDRRRYQSLEDAFAAETFFVYNTNEVDDLLGELKNELAKLKRALHEAELEIKRLSAELLKQIDSLPATLPTDLNAIALIRMQLQPDFDQRYLRAAPP